MSQDVADVMAEKLPLGKEYECRKDAMQALRLAVLESTGHAVMVDKKASGKNRVVIRCNSLFKLPAEQERGRKQCVLYQLEGFVCLQEAGETPHQHACWRTLCFKQYSSLTVCLTISIASVRPSVLKKLKFNIRYLNILSFIDHNTVKKIDMPYSYYKVIKCIVNGII